MFSWNEIRDEFNALIKQRSDQLEMLQIPGQNQVFDHYHPVESNRIEEIEELISQIGCSLNNAADMDYKITDFDDLDEVMKERFYEEFPDASYIDEEYLNFDAYASDHEYDYFEVHYKGRDYHVWTD